MKVGVISNNDLCLPLLFFLLNNKVETHLYFSRSSVIDPKRQAVHHFCSTYSVAYIDEEKGQESIYTWTSTIDADFLFVLGHLKKIDCQKAKARFGTYNIHFGKLPEYRGASPVFWQMKKMEPTLGLAIHALTDEMDAGAIYWSKEISNEDHFTHNYVQYLFSNLMLEGVGEILVKTSNGKLQSEQQDESKACWHSKPSLRDVLINWNTMAAAEICSLVHACNNWNIGAITLYQGMELKIVDASLQVAVTSKNHAPGTISSLGETVNVSCINGDEIQLHYLSLNGIPIAARHARKYGIMEGERFTYPMD